MVSGAGSRRGGRVTPKGTPPQPSERGRKGRRRSGDAGTGPEPELFGEVRRLLSGGGPAGFVELVAGLIATADERLDGGSSGALPSLGELVETFAGVERPETTALLAGFAALVGDGELRRRALGELGFRRHRLPAWMADLGQARISRAAGLVRGPAMGEETLVEVALAGGEVMTVVLTVAGGVGVGDQPVGGATRDDPAGGPPDGLVVGAALEELIVAALGEVDRTGRVRGSGPPEVDRPGCRLAPGASREGRGRSGWWELDPETARSRVEAALRADPSAGDPATSHWPAIRPVVEWVARLAAGGAGAGPGVGGPGVTPA